MPTVIDKMRSLKRSFMDTISIREDNADLGHVTNFKKSNCLRSRIS